jgi:hypothetical protein
VFTKIDFVFVVIHTENNAFAVGRVTDFGSDGKVHISEVVK